MRNGREYGEILLMCVCDQETMREVTYDGRGMKVSDKRNVMSHCGVIRGMLKVNVPVGKKADVLNVRRDETS
jgi:hypothetical protein